MVYPNFKDKHLEEALKKENFIEVVLISHMFIEVYLKEIIKDSLALQNMKINKKKFPENSAEVLKIIEESRYFKLCEIGLLLEEIEPELYKRLLSFNTMRRDMAHSLFKNTWDKETTRGYAMEGKKLMTEIFLLEIYMSDKLEDFIEGNPRDDY